jgi:hypothetical protein
MCHMLFMHLYRNALPHHIFSIRKNHSLRNLKLNHNIFNGCRQGVTTSWPLLSNPKCIVDCIHLNMSLQRLFDVFFVNPQHFSNTSTTTNWWTRNKHTYNVFGNYKLNLLWTYQMTCDPRFHVVQNFLIFLDRLHISKVFMNYILYDRMTKKLLKDRMLNGRFKILDKF